MPQFARYLGIDYSGAEKPTSSLRGLRLYSATPATLPVEIPPPPSPRKYWTRRGLAEWLAAELRDDPPTLVGIDHAFSFPLRYFEVHRLPPDWPAFLDDFQQHWPTDGEDTYVQCIRDGLHGHGAQRPAEHCPLSGCGGRADRRREASPWGMPSRSPGRGPPYWKSRVLRRQALGDENQCGDHGGKGDEAA